MRTLLIPALALIMGCPMFAHDGREDWKYRSRRPHGPELHRGYETRPGRDWDHPRFGHRGPGRPWHHERGMEMDYPEPPPVHVHPLPPPPPPPVGIHLWFGF